MWRHTRVAAAALAAAATMSVLAAGQSSAEPYTEPNLVDTVRCDSADPWSPGRLRIDIDVYNDVVFPPDGARGPVLYLSANNSRPGFLLDYNVEATVRWVNTTTGARGTRIIPARGRSASWEGSLPTGRGHVAYVVTQKIGALAFMPMVNPQSSTCRGAATV
ncbi:hypothetical protein [Williamsia sp. R60]